MTIKDQISKDPRVASVWDESGTDDGYWVNLKSGFADLSNDPHQPTHTIHEWNWSDIQRRMRDVKPCVCKECLEVINRAKD
jgi:hypothetical protein